MPLEIGEKKSSRGNVTQSSFFLRAKKGAGGGDCPSSSTAAAAKRKRSSCSINHSKATHGRRSGGNETMKTKAGGHKHGVGVG